MKVHIFSIMWNEEYILPYFLRYYETFADKIFIFNDHSTDRTTEIAKAHPKVTLLEYPYGRMLHEGDHSDCFQNAYKKYSRGIADWVMCVDADEIIYNKDLLGVLRRQTENGMKILKSTGYQMVSEILPKTDKQLYEVCKTGGRSRGYDKPVILNPEIDVVFGEGRHSVQLPDGLQAVKAGLLLLHYRYLSRDFVINRAKTSYPRWYKMAEDQQTWRLDRALKWYDHVIKNPQELETVV